MANLAHQSVLSGNTSFMGAAEAASYFSLPLEHTAGNSARISYAHCTSHRVVADFHWYYEYILICSHRQFQRSAT